MRHFCIRNEKKKDRMFSSSIIGIRRAQSLLLLPAPETTEEIGDPLKGFALFAMYYIHPL
jgi:hypothetical protein